MLSRTRSTSIYVRQLVTGHYCRLEVTYRELYCRYRRPLQSVILVRNAGDRSEFLSDIHVKIWTQKGRFIFDGLQFEKPRCLVILVKGRLAVRLKSGVRFDELRPLYEDREKVTVTARGVILHPAE